MIIGREVYSQNYYNTEMKEAIKEKAAKELVTYQDNKSKENSCNSLDGGEQKASIESSLEDNKARREALRKLLYDEFGVTNAQLKEDMSGMSGIPEKKIGAPYTFLSNGTGMINYEGVTFYCDDLRRQLCLGDMSNPEDVIRIPMSEGGCLMVNRNDIEKLQHAIGMFSSEDVNRILRALKMDGKIQQMEKEIEEMEDGIGKNSKEQNADGTTSAKEAKEESQTEDGFNGYENKSEDSDAQLTSQQLDMLTEDLVEYLGNKGTNKQ